jgi:O-antigen/teichoic acid export membrane protein
MTTTMTTTTTAPPARPSLRRNVSWSLLGNLLYMACQWGWTVLLTKYLTTNDVGDFTYAFAVMAPVFMFARMNLRNLQATDAAEAFAFGHYLSFRLLCNYAALLVAAGVCIWLHPGRTLLLLLLAVAIAKAAENVSDVVYGLLQHRELMGRVAQSMSLKGLLSVAIFWGVLATTHSLLASTLGLAVSWLLTTQLFDLPLARRLVPERPLARWEWPALQRLCVAAIPFAVLCAFLSLAPNLPRYAIQHYLGAHALGIFGPLSYLQVASSMITMSLSLAVAPRVAKLYYAGHRAACWRLISKLVLLCLALGGLGIIAALVAGRPILRLLYTPEYANYTAAFTWLMVAAAGSSLGSLLNYLVTAVRYQIALTVLTVLTTCTIALASFGLVPHHGLTGAAWALLAGAGVQTVGGLGILLHALRRPVAPPPDAASTLSAGELTA